MTPRIGDVVLVSLDPTRGTEQAGQRPAAVIGGPFNWDSLVIAVPLTTTNRGWATHVAVRTNKVSYAMCEQVRSISVDRVARTLGALSSDDLQEVQFTVSRLINVYNR